MAAVKKNNQRADRGSNKKAGNTPKLSAEEERELLARTLKLKPKTKAFVDLLLENPKLSLTEAYIRTHETTNRKAASTRASELVRKSSVKIYSQAAVGKAKRRIVELVQSSNESIALKASQDIVDREHGKASQTDDSTPRTVRVELDLSGLRIGAHYLSPQQLAEIPVNP